MSPQLPSVLTVPRTDPIYNSHSYLTKIPVGAIEPFLEHFTRPGDTVVDFFAGSGMTGIAALRTGRNAQLSDISALGQHIFEGYLTHVAPNVLLRAGEAACAIARKQINDLYSVVRAEDGQHTEMVRTLWSFTYRCPSCGQSLVYYERLRKGKTKPPDKCHGCEHEFIRRLWPRGEDLPVAVAVRSMKGRIKDQPVRSHDMKLIEQARLDPRQTQVPSHKISSDREMYRRCALKKSGLTETKFFFSPRNSIVLLELWTAINKTKEPSIRTKLLFAFTAILGRASRRYQWGPKRPLNSQNQTYYIAPVYYEWNVFELFMRKVKAALRSDDMIFGPLLSHDLAKQTVTYNLASADTLSHVANQSVDYVFTDPPFGSNLFYSDMNLFHEAWLGTITDRSHEAVIVTATAKRETSTLQYEKLLTGAFTEAHRILKPSGKMSVVFGNSNGTVWALFQRALQTAGFNHVPTHVTILDKGQRSVKGLASGSESIVTVDLVLTVEKRKDWRGPKDLPTSTLTPAVAADLFDAAIHSLDSDKARNPSYVYAALLRVAISKGLSVEQLHLSDMLNAFRTAGLTLNAATGLLTLPATTKRVKTALARPPGC